MITVRFSSGFSIQYNAGARVEMWGDMIKIKDRSDVLLAMAPKDSVIEWTYPCRTYNPIATDSDSVKAEVAALRREVRSLTRKVGKIGGGK